MPTSPEPPSSGKVASLVAREAVLRERVLSADLTLKQREEMEGELAEICRLLELLGYRRIA